MTLRDGRGIKKKIAATEQKGKQGRKAGRNLASKEGRKEGGKQSSKEGRKEARQERSKESSKAGSKEGRKEGRKEASREEMKQGRKDNVSSIFPACGSKEGKIMLKLLYFGTFNLFFDPSLLRDRVTLKTLCGSWMVDGQACS